MWQACVALVAFGIWAFAMERLSKILQPMMLMACSSMIWFFLEPLVGVFYWKLGKAQGEVFTFSYSVLWWFLLVVLMGSIGTTLMTISLRNESQVIATVIPSAYPVVALLLSMLFVGKSFQLLEWLGSILIIMGIVALSWSDGK